jgi:hypothetical protein
MLIEEAMAWYNDIESRNATTDETSCQSSKSTDFSGCIPRQLLKAKASGNSVNLV